MEQVMTQTSLTPVFAKSNRKQIRPSRVKSSIVVEDKIDRYSSIHRMIGPLMATVSKQRRDSRNQGSMMDAKWIRAVVLLFVAGLLVFFVASTTRETSNPALAAGMTDVSDTTVVEVKTAGGMSAGHLAHGSFDGVAYYHCGAHTRPLLRDIILLHGAKFTKEDWKKSTIMGKLCAHGRHSVTALDFPVSADGARLQKILRGLAIGEGLLEPEGNYVVVTPSASGKSIVSWINDGDLDELMETVGLWVPIASPAIDTANVDKLHALREQSWPILALYGDQDPRGKKVSQLLEKEANAKIKEFPGPHPFYFDIPEAFSKYLLENI